MLYVHIDGYQYTDDSWEICFQAKEPKSKKWCAVRKHIITRNQFGVAALQEQWADFRMLLAITKVQSSIVVSAKFRMKSGHISEPSCARLNKVFTT